MFCTAQNNGSVYSHTDSRNEDFETVMVDLDHHAELRISTTVEKSFYSTDEKQSGEYQNALVLNTKVLNDTLFVTDSLNPLFTFPQDKLSAHKITDTKAVLILPEKIMLFLNLLNANLEIKGNYENVIINIHSGKVVLKDTQGNIQITSVNANVEASGLGTYKYEPFTRNGIIKIENKNKKTRYLLKVESINGDIQLH